MKGKIKIGVIGFGKRGTSLLKDVMLPMDDVEIRAVCDSYEDRMEEARKLSEEAGNPNVFASTDYREILKIEEIDAIVITCAWEFHIDIACEAMLAGKYVGIEVGGAYDIEQCWRLVRTSEKTGMPCMMLENCCYGKTELMVLNMVKKGLFGEIVHCAGGYHHDLRDEIATGIEKRHYRLRNYLNRNCDNYNTHELGPIAKLLNINRGNRMLSLTSVASKSAGMAQYVRDNMEGLSLPSHEKEEESKHLNSSLKNAVFHQGDIVTTTVKCAGGQTIVMTLDTTLPRAYCRGFTVCGTKGRYEEQTDSIFIDGQHNKYDENWKEQWGNADTYHTQYDHPIWQEAKKNEIKGGHGGMDWMVFRAFFESVKAQTNTPIDVYDTASWMCISVLSEQSVLLNGAPVPIPDFTCGRWMNREPYIRGKYCLEEIIEE